MLVAVATLFITHFAAAMTRLAISRSREYMADAGAVELTKNPDAMISALKKISGHDHVPLAVESLRAMMISNPFDDEDPMDALFATHPAIADRVASLVRYAGGRDVTPLAARAGGAAAISGEGLEPGVSLGFAAGRRAFGKRRRPVVSRA